MKTGGTCEERQKTCKFVHGVHGVDHMEVQKNMVKVFAIAAVMLVIGMTIVIVSGGLAGLVSGVGTALATLGIEQARRTYARRYAKGQVTDIGAGSYEKENESLTLYKK